ncbi:MAG: sigma-70 family RNA polymerase sigma factor [Planctomycetota bacterium]
MPPETVHLSDLLTHDAFVRSLARSLVYDSSTADDVAQEAWLSALQNPPHDGGSIKSWFATVVRNFSSKSRRGSVRRAIRERAHVRDEIAPSTAEILEREAVRRRVVEQVVSLDEPYRTVVLLRYFDHLPPRDIARKLQIPVETVRTRLKRALIQLRERLDEQHSGSRVAWCGPLSALAVIDITVRTKVIASAAAAVFLVSAFLGIVYFTPPPDVAAENLKYPIAGADAGGSNAIATKVDRVPAGPSAEAAGVSTAQANVKDAARAIPGTLRVQILWGDDNTPAAGVFATVSDSNYNSDPYLRARRYQTGSDGSFIIEGVGNNNMTIHADRGGYANVSTAPGRKSEIVVTIPPGMSVEGRVVDEQGSVVANAQIFLSEQLFDCDAHQVASSSADGKFTIRSVRNDALIGARAAGHGPSNLYTLRGKAGAKRNITLTLRGRGGSAGGQVINYKNQPVANAIVRIGGDAVRMLTFDEREPFGLRMRTDVNGKFHFAGVGAGSHSVAVRAPDFALSTQQIDVGANANCELKIQLEASAFVEGKILKEDGSPAENVNVFISFNKLTPGLDPLETVRVVTKEDGNYRMEGIILGLVDIQAIHNENGRASGKLQIAAGAPTRWDAKLTTDPKIKGKVIDSAGAPLKGWIVEADPGFFDPQVLIGNISETNAAGEFAFKNCYERAHTLAVRPPGPSRAPSATRANVVPGAEEVILQIPDDARPTARIVGNLVDASGKGVEDAIIIIWQVGVGGSEPIVPTSQGRFRLGPLVPGTYRIEIRPKDYPVIYIPDRFVKANETWDTGVVRIEPPGKLHAEIAFERNINLQNAGAPKLQMWIEGAGGALLGRGEPVRVLQTSPLITVASEPLAPGEYIFIVSGAGVATAATPFRVAAGGESRVSVVLKEGVSRTLKIVPAAGGMARAVRVTVAEDGGGIVYDTKLIHQNIGDAFQLTIGLAAGNYTVVAEGRDGARAEGNIKVTDLSVANETIELAFQ